MINQIAIENFQGKTGRWNLNNLTVITGPNGVGKSTIVKAAQLLLLGSVPGDSVNDTVGEQYRAYCSEEGGLMSVEVSTDAGTIRREWKMSKGRVSTQATFNGVDLPAKSSFADLLQVKIFDLARYWDSTPSQQIATLCGLAGVNPADLDRLDKELELVNTEKRNLMDKNKEAKQALVDHEAELQATKEASRLEGANPATVESEIAELQKKADRLSKQIRTEQEGQAQAKANADRLTDLKNRCIETNDELQALRIPMADSAEQLEAELVKLENTRSKILDLEKAKKKIETLRGRHKEPMPCAYKDADIQDLTEKIVAAESGAGVDKSATVAYEAASTVFVAAQMAMKARGISEEDRKFVIEAIREACAVYKQAKSALDNQTPLAQVVEWKSKIGVMKKAIADYQLAYAHYQSAYQEIRDIESEIKAVGVVKFDIVRYERVRDEISAIRGNIDARKAAIEKRDRLQANLEKMLAEIATLEAKAPVAEAVSVESLIAERDAALEAIKPLRADLQSVVAWQTIRNLADKKETEIDRLNKDLDQAKNREKALQSEKARLLESVQTTLADRADRILHPCRLTFELPTTTKATDRIKFLRHSPNGDVVERGTLSGYERVEFDIALAHALVGKDGVVIAEASEIEQANMEKLLASLEAAGGAQTVIVGHSLEWATGMKGVDVIHVAPVAKMRRSA